MSYEQKYNALFDKCVEKCDPAVMKEVSDNVDKMLGRQLADALEKEIGKWMVEDCGPSDFNPYAEHWCADDIQRTARHFYELGCTRTAEMYDDIEYERQRAEEAEPSDDLEEEIAEMYQALFGTDIINRKEMLYLDTFNAIARHFAEWGATHLKK